MFKLLLVLAVPAPFFTYFSLTSSYTAGVLTSCILLLIFSTSQWQWHENPIAGKLSAIILLSLFLTCHLAVCAVNLPIDWGRGLGSLVVLSIFCLGALVAQRILLLLPNTDVHRGLRWGLCWIGFVLLLGITGIFQPDTQTWTKSLFPFSEPSHLALFLAPLLIFNCVTATTRLRLLFLSITLLATAFLQNVTMASVCLLAAALSLSPRHLLLLAAVLVPIVGAIDLEYYLVRLDFSGESENLSNLVFFQGWQLIIESWQKSHGLGLGFQQLGIFGTDAEAAELIYIIMGDYLNLFDGGFNLAKFISEFGFLGLILIAAFTRQVYSAAKLLRASARRSSADQAALLFAASCLCAYTIEIFLRGVGYFSPSGLLFAAALLIWVRRKKRLVTNKQRTQSPQPEGGTSSSSTLSQAKP